MTTVVRTDASIDGQSAVLTPTIDKDAGGVLRAGFAGRVNSSGLIVESDGVADAVAANVHGIIAKDVPAAGMPATLYGLNIAFRYSKAGALTPGDTYYLADISSNNAWDDTATLGDVDGACFAEDEFNLVFMKARLA